MAKGKFHITEDGNVMPCSAKPGNCPITKETGGEHYDTKEDAQAAYEKQQSFVGMKTLSSIVDPEKFRKFIDEGYISERKHPDDDSLRVYSYTPKVQFSGMWTDETLLARGLILKTGKDGNLKDATIHARALGKFFTVEQMSEGDWTNIKLVDDDENVTVQENAPIDFDAPATVMDKMNGALGVGYIAPDGRAQISTKGSFGSTEAEIGSKIFDKYGSEELGKFMQKRMKNQTPLFEIITPERPHPVNYGDMEDVVLLGTVNKITGKWSPVEENHKLVQQFGFQTPEKIPATTLREALAIPYRENTEGMVVTTTDEKGKQKMYKVKPEEYHNLRSAFYKMNKGKSSETIQYVKNTDIMSITQASDIDLDISEQAKQWEPTVQKKLFEEVIQPTQVKTKQVNDDLDKILADNKIDVNDSSLRKLIGTSNHPDKSLLFKALDERSGKNVVLSNVVKDQVLRDL